MRSTWFCVDIECSGPVPAIYDCISIGAVAVSVVDGEFVLSPTFYVEICPCGPKVDLGAMAVNGLSLEDLRANGLPRRQAYEALSGFVAEHTVNNTKPVFVGHNAPFDWSFVNHDYHAEGLVNPFGYKALDTKALAMGVLGLHWFDSSKEELDRLLSLPVVEENKVHRADYDAWYQAHLLKELLLRMPKAAVEGGRG